jgi:hypothetical protein
LGKWKAVLENWWYAYMATLLKELKKENPNTYTIIPVICFRK